MMRNSLIGIVVTGILCVLSPANALGQQATATAQPKTISKLEVEVIYLEKNGCFPTQISRPQGQEFRLWVVNKSGSPDVQISLQNATSLAVQSAKQFAPLDARWLQLINLPAGTYSLTSTGAQKFGCTIVLK